MTNKCSQCHISYNPQKCMKGCPKSAPDVEISEEEFKNPLSDVVAYQVFTENNTWGPPFVSKSVAQYFENKGMKVRKLIVKE